MRNIVNGMELVLKIWFNLFHPDFKFIGIGIESHRDYGICVVIGYAMNVRPLGSEPKNVSDFIQEYIKNTMNRKKIKNPFQEDEPDAPDNTVSLKIVKGNKMIGSKKQCINWLLETESDIFEVNIYKKQRNNDQNAKSRRKINFR